MIKQTSTKYSGIVLNWDTKTDECWITFGNCCDAFIGFKNDQILDQAHEYIEKEILPAIKH